MEVSKQKPQAGAFTRSAQVCSIWSNPLG